MAKTFTDPAEISAEYRKRRRRHWLVLIPLALVLIPFMVMGDNQHQLFGVPAIVFAGLDAVVVIAVFAFVLIDWRCPACNRFLRGEMNVPKCPKCGAELT